jgi:citrate/tricarballylate utilization protein
MSTIVLNQLISEAKTTAEIEVTRQMQICNACRYCEGYCAVFPAMTRRLEFGKADIHYLANLCHNCGACYHACQYAPPHEFAVNVPKSMAQVRAQTYADYAWPSVFGALYKRNGLTLALALSACLALFLIAMLNSTVLMTGSLFNKPLAGNFYAIFPHNLLVSMFLPIFAFVVLALTMGVRQFWRNVTAHDDVNDVVNKSTGQISSVATAEAASDVLKLKYLGGGHGEGCNNENDAWTLWRKRFHHATFYGFMLCFASTSVATVYHYVFNWQAPYPLNFSLTSLPVLLGTLGGIGLLIGPAGLLWLNLLRDPKTVDVAQKPMDLGFIALLFLTSLTGLALMLWRDTSLLALLLAIHLGVVMALFVTLPYGKFAHGIFRSAALLKWAIEKRMSNRLKLGSD